MHYFPNLWKALRSWEAVVNHVDSLRYASPYRVAKAASAWPRAGCLHDSKSAHTGSRGASPLLSGQCSLHVIKGSHASQHASANYTGLTRVSWKSKGFGHSSVDKRTRLKTSCSSVPTFNSNSLPLLPFHPSSHPVLPTGRAVQTWAVTHCSTFCPNQI